MKSFAIASGSSGNCYYVESKNTKVLVDCGISFSKAKDILADKKINVEEINAVFITHEHGDHISGLGAFLKNLDCPFYLSKGTLEGSKYCDEKFKIVKNHDFVKIEDVNVFVVDKPHDVDEAISFVFEAEGKKVGIFSDLGYVTDEIKHILKGLDVIYIEANYCHEHIKLNGKDLHYNYVSRLTSDSGHLGVDQTIEVLKEVANERQKIILSHISENTTTYENIYSKVKEALSLENIFPELDICFQSEPSEWVE